MNTQLKRLIQYTFLAICLLPSAALAHIKWFVEADKIVTQETVRYSLTQPSLIIWIGIVLATVTLCWWLEKKIPEPSKRFLTTVSKWKPRVIRIVEFTIGLWILIAVFQDHIIAPPFIVTGTFTTALQLIAGITGVLLILGILAPIAAVLLFTLFLGAGLEYGFLNLFEHLHIVGIAFFLLVSTRLKQSETHLFEPWAIPILRFTTGFSLVLLGLQEKILHPELGLAFLKTHQWNFMQGIGMTAYSDLLFILSAGMMELLFGVLLILGISTRTTTIALSFFFISSAILLGPAEVMGHLPVFAIALVLILYGAGEKIRVTHKI